MYFRFLTQDGSPGEWELGPAVGSSCDEHLS